MRKREYKRFGAEKKPWLKLYGIWINSPQPAEKHNPGMLVITPIATP
jgi:hypothetical protein